MKKCHYYLNRHRDSYSLESLLKRNNKVHETCPLHSRKEQKEAKVVEGNHKKGEKQQQQREGKGKRRRLCMRLVPKQVFAEGRRLGGF